MPSFGTRWACDECLRGRAVPATPERQFPGQSCGCFYPHYAYYDEVIPCKQCGEQFVFSASEQRFWYEERKFVQYSSPVRCAPCRRAVRAVNVPHRKLTELIPLVRSGDPTPIPIIVEQYVKLGRVEAAKKFLAETTKLYARNEKVLGQIKELRAGI